MKKPFYQEELDKLDIKIDVAQKDCPVDAGLHLQLTGKLAEFYKKMKKKQSSIKEVWKPKGEWQNYNEERSSFYGKLLNNEIEEADRALKDFWRNKLGMIVKEYAKFEDLASLKREVVDPFRELIGRNYLIWKDLFNAPVESLRLKRYIGNPWGCLINNVLVTPKAVRFHTNATQIKNILADADDRVIAEIGGGYGGLAYYLCNEMKNFKYVNFDLPETLVLCAYYLTLNFPEKKVYLGSEGCFNDNEFKRYDLFLLPNYLIESMPEKSADLFFNSFSLSEMMPETNLAYIQEIARITKGYFLHNNMDRKGVVNRGFERIPASSYNVDKDKFVLLNKNYDLFHSHFGDYKEFLYKVT